MVHTTPPPGLRWDSTLFVQSRPEFHQSQRADRRGPEQRVSPALSGPGLAWGSGPTENYKRKLVPVPRSCHINC